MFDDSIYFIEDLGQIDYNRPQRPSEVTADLLISRVAQLVEQAAVNRLVAGSSPAAGALKIPIEIIQTWGPTEWSVN